MVTQRFRENCTNMYCETVICLRIRNILHASKQKRIRNATVRPSNKSLLITDVSYSSKALNLIFLFPFSVLLYFKGKQFPRWLRALDLDGVRLNHS
jgi:hypothetical protein